MPVAHPDECSVPIAEARRRARGSRIVELLQPEKKLLSAPENDHQIDSVVHAHRIRRAIAEIGRPFWAQIWTRLSGRGRHKRWGVSDPARRLLDQVFARQAGSLTPLSSPTTLFFRRPDRQKAPADSDASIDASSGTFESWADD